MKLNILPTICLINYVFAFPIFDELWQTNQSEPQPNNNPIESQPKIKVEPHEEQFDGRWQDKTALKGIVKVEHEPPLYGAVKLEGTVKMKHEFEWMDEASSKFKEQLGNHVKEEGQDGQDSNTFDQKKIGDNDDYWEEDENNSAPSADDYDQNNTKKHLFNQNNSTDQDESVNKQQNETNKCQKIDSAQQKWEIIQKFREMKEDYTQKRKYSANEHIQIESKISNVLGVARSTIYKWIKELGLSRETKSKFSDFEKRQILKQFDEIKSKCKKAKLKNITMNELNEKIEKKLGVCFSTINEWKRKFGLSDSKTNSDATKIELLKKYAKIKGKNPKMRDCDIADLLKISISSLKRWKAQFKEEIKNL